MAASPLSDDERAKLSARADEFYAALVRGGVSDWEQFLAGLPERLRLPVLTELVIIDLIHRWGHGERVQVEVYVARFPELGPRDQIPPQLIVEECRCKMKAGERVDPSAVESRFPVQFPQIRKEVESLRGETVTGTVVPTLASGAGTPGLPQAPGRIPNQGAEDYEFIRLLGRGVFGEVWLARKIAPGIEKAIKILLQSPDHEAALRERQSLELIKNLRHPYLLATEDFWVAGNRLHIVMELADCTLRNRLQRCRDDGLVGIPEFELLSYIWEAAEGLDFLHSRRVMHRDVKPDNILLLNGHAKIADFGLARQQEGSMAPMRTLAGTPTYMAPEVWGKEGGPASDQYSLAVTYIELRQGHASLKARPIEEMLLAHYEGAHELSDIIGPDERKVLLKALSRDPEERYPSCQTFAEALSAALGRPGAPRASGSVPSSSARRAVAAVVAPTLADPEIASPTHSGGALGTVVESDTRKRTQPDTRPPRWKLVAVSVLVLAVVSALGFGVWSLLGGGDSVKPTGETPVKPTGNGGGEITVKPTRKDNGNGGKPKDVWQLPARFVPIKDYSKEVTLADGRMVFDLVTVAVGEEKVRFWLIGGGQGSHPVDPFYIMESKVWNALYRLGGSEPPAKSDENGPDCPVTDITAEQAARFAKIAFEGKLPSPDEWDHAAGYYRRPRPDSLTHPGGSPRVHIAKPRPTHGTVERPDVSVFGLRDMAGNGREWTRGVLKSAKIVESDTPGPTDFVILRGRNFTLEDGLTFGDLDYQQTTPQTQFAGKGSQYTSFRVMIPLPPLQK
jgi:serine/threonine protein kinase